MCIYIYSFPPLSRNNRSRFETSYSRISIGDRDASRRQKASEREEKKERRGGDETISRGQASSSSFCGDGTVFSRNTRVKEAGAIK